MTELGDLADLVRRFRLEARISQEALAERAGLSARTVSDLECGVARSPRAMTLTLLSEALGLSPADRDLLRIASRSTFGKASTQPAFGRRYRRFVSSDANATSPWRVACSSKSGFGY